MSTDSPRRDRRSSACHIVLTPQSSRWAAGHHRSCRSSGDAGRNSPCPRAPPRCYPRAVAEAQARRKVCLSTPHLFQVSRQPWLAPIWIETGHGHKREASMPWRRWRCPFAPLRPLRVLTLRLPEGSLCWRALQSAPSACLEVAAHIRKQSGKIGSVNATTDLELATGRQSSSFDGSAVRRHA